MAKRHKGGSSGGGGGGGGGGGDDPPPESHWLVRLVCDSFLIEAIKGWYIPSKLPSKDVLATFEKAKWLIRPHKWHAVYVAFHLDPTGTANTFNEYLQLPWSGMTLVVSSDDKLSIGAMSRTGANITSQTPPAFIKKSPEFRNQHPLQQEPYPLALQSDEIKRMCFGV